MLLGAQQISTGVPGVKAAWADTLDRDFSTARMSGQ